MIVSWLEMAVMKPMTLRSNILIEKSMMTHCMCIYKLSCIFVENCEILKTFRGHISESEIVDFEKDVY